uniref:Folylpolyglutamate synthase n=1 Tax=Nelumbo nucifera TaxID=4432 RepID=A0A822YE48_NELNU|nr:TPA_asm: hypothetical protein HUJ06_030987 [Nelumbo nucifera]
MLGHLNNILGHAISEIPHLCRRGPQQFFIRKLQKIPCSASFFPHDQTDLSLRYKKWLYQVIEKMGSSEILLRNLQDLPLSSSYETAMEALSSLITSEKRGSGKNIGGAKSSRYRKLDRMLMYLEILGLEECIPSLKIIHVAGTKGKGSTCAFCEAILRECGFRTGLFTSPHLIDVRERFRIDGLDISEDKFLQYFWDCWNQLKENVTEDLPMPPLFQFLTVLAFKIFVCEKVDVAIIEVGLGGTLDSTNVIKEPIVCGITSLGMDHMESLGNTLGEIASHKAGIFKPQIPAFTVPQLSEAMDVLQGRASELMVPLEVVPPLDPKRWDRIKLSLSGDHQFINASLAVALCKCWLQSTGNWEKVVSNETDMPAAFLRGLSTARLSGRAQIIHDTLVIPNTSPVVKENSSGDLIFYLDGAHSPESMEVCARWFSSAVKEDKISPFEEQIVERLWRNDDARHGKENIRGTSKIAKQILLFNCMDVRDPQALLPRLVNTCASSGVHFSKALFVPSMSTYNKVTSAASIIPSDFSNKDLTWQFTLQRTWEKIMHGKDSGLGENSKIDNPEALPLDGFLSGDYSKKCNPADKQFTFSTVIPSLPLTIKWLRDSVKENPSIRIQVLVTGSLHLIGDVMKLLRR